MDVKEITKKRNELNSVCINNAATGRRIRSLCKNSEITLGMLSEILGFAGQQAVYNWVEGKAKPTLENIMKIALLFGIDVNEIIVISQKAEKNYSSQRLFWL